MDHKLVITGYGWLAGYLSDALNGDLLDGKLDIIGTSRQESKLSLLADKGVTPVHYALGGSTQALCEHLKHATLLINIPPGRRNTDLDAFTQNMKSLIDDAITAQAAHIIFISTTSVYGDNKEPALSDVNEKSAVAPETASAKAHVAIEQHLASKATSTKYTIVRLAGLVGPDRHPARSLSGRSISDGNKRVNLVHITDVVEALSRIIRTPPAENLLHLCSLAHPKRGEYYVTAAHALTVPPPEFSETDLPPMGKVINASKSWQVLGITPTYSNPDDMY